MKPKKMFKTFEISPVVENHNGAVQPYSSIEAAKKKAHEIGGRMFWSLYGKTNEGHSECIADRETYEFTASMYQRLTGLQAPEIAGQCLLLPEVPTPEELLGKVSSMRSLLNKADQVLAKADEMIEEAIQLHVYGEDDDIPPDCNFTACLNQIRQVREQLK